MKNAFKIILSSFALMILFSAFGAAVTNAQSPLVKTLNLLEEHRKAMTSLKADITMVNFDNILKESATKTGTVMYGAFRKKAVNDTYVRIDWLRPKNEIISVVKQQFLAYDVTAGVAYTGNAKSGSKGGGGLVKLITNSSKEELKSKFNVEYVGVETLDGAEVVHLKLTPKTKQDFKSADIWVDGNGMPLQGKITAPNNDSQTIRFSNLQKNVTIDSAKFEVKLPSGLKPTKV